MNVVTINRNHLCHLSKVYKHVGLTVGASVALLFMFIGCGARQPIRKSNAKALAKSMPQWIDRSTSAITGTVTIDGKSATLPVEIISKIRAAIKQSELYEPEWRDKRLAPSLPTTEVEIDLNDSGGESFSIRLMKPNLLLQLGYDMRRIPREAYADIRASCQRIVVGDTHNEGETLIVE